MGNRSYRFEEKVDRAGFFRWGANRLKRAAGELITSSLEAAKGEDVVTGWSRLVNEKVIGGRPRLYFAKGQPFFVVNSKKAGSAIFSGSCAEDGGLLEWRDNLERFYCPFCQSTYDREGNSDGSSDVVLPRPESRVVDGYVMVKVPN